MKTIDELPRPIREDANVWIPMSDGTRLAARIWRPRDGEPVPAILEYIPYRKRFGTAQRDEVMHPYVAGHGYACVRVDLRGSGESDGVLEDEYLQQELDDGCEVLKWLASQPWCTGKIGMIGISWGGFNGLQIAALQPPELKAVVAVCASDDRFADDVHHMGGCLLGDNISWASVMFAYNSLPPDPDLVGDRWREMWFDRLEGSGLWLEKWLQHQRRDEYWQHASVCEDYSAIQCPVYAVSGWADGYSNVVFRLMEHLQVPRKGLIGPWSHKYPHQGVPGPAIGFVQEVVRWWDQWLKDTDSGIMDEPMLRVWMQDSVPPVTYYKQRPGRWVAESEWPAERVSERHLALSSEGLVPARDEPEPYATTVRSPLTVGLFAGKWCSYAAGPDLAHDQREEDGGALVFQSEPLEETFEIMGEPYLDLEISSDRPVAMIAARLSDMAPDDKATRITYGLLNLTHRDSSECPEPLEPGKVYRVRVSLNAIAQVFPAGHRLRLSLSTSYWPLAWPPPEPVCLHVHTQNSCLVLPQRQPTQADAALPEFDPPEGTAPSPVTHIEAGHHNWLVHRDLALDKSTLEVINDDGCFHLDDIDMTVAKKTVETYTTVADDFHSPRAKVVSERTLARGDWQIRTVTRTFITSTATHFLLHANIDAYELSDEGEKRVYSDNWDESIPRDLV
ncbi:MULTISPECIES: CocE/NonD family hydrolase [unclassified Wenzhouxiangella]|uniref:CocE/NonD family hydrolase n=1 Tax=unclassified Wenzhouxiangella TaxID=2613841 RepID=UPI000E3283A5|nr:MULTISPECIES: CocE/NonD family hydrolase [unclassified Wenzhouxiangella]RFF26863.1 CocE/NonD family hydrolase [Wenzhouxiangella sp. 15181]RFP68483.1 CocE/NonD family hydrolase [Wenzhouxiangella sp. 15190]